MISCFADAPIEILCSILRLLPVHDKLRCEGVCKHWLTVVRGSHVLSSRSVCSTIWGGALSVAISPPQNVRDKILLAQGVLLPRVLLQAAATSETQTERAFIRWFARVAPVLDKVVVSLQSSDQYQVNHDGGWVFPQILAKLHLGQITCPGVELHLTAGTVVKVMVYPYSS